MKRIGIVCTLLIFIILLLPSSVLSLDSDTEISEVVNNNDSSPSLIIEEVSMIDYNVLCSMLGGQYVSIGVLVGNQGDEEFNGTLSVEIFTDQVSYLEQQNITVSIGIGHSRLVTFQNVHINEEIGKHTLDAYINENIHTRNYCEFKSTLTGIDTLNMIDYQSINVMHPNEKSIYLGWMSKYLGFAFPELDYTIILGKNIYNRIYGFKIISDTNLSYIEIYVNEKLEMTLDEPTGYDGICQEWQVHWCPRGYNEIRLMAIDQYNSRFNAYRNLLVI